MQDLKRMSWVFWSACGGLVICLGGTVYTAVQQQHERKAIEAAVGMIPVPAMPGQPSMSAPAPVAPAAPGGIPVPAR